MIPQVIIFEKLSERTANSYMDNYPPGFDPRSLDDDFLSDTDGDIIDEKGDQISFETLDSWYTPINKKQISN